MSIMLAAIFAAVVVGMFTRGSSPRQLNLVAAIALTLVGLYFLRPYYMT